MVRLTETLVLARSRASDLENVRKLNCWGNELSDVSIFNKVPNIQVLSLSVNKISTLAHFANCSELEELYIRKNDIQNLSEIKYLKKLPKLTKLWLGGNPCAECEKYRLTVLKALPNLEKLDNVAVTPEEVNQALDEGIDLEELLKSPPINQETPPQTDQQNKGRERIPATDKQTKPSEGLTVSDQQVQAFEDLHVTDQQIKSQEGATDKLTKPGEGVPAVTDQSPAGGQPEALSDKLDVDLSQQEAALTAKANEDIVLKPIPSDTDLSFPETNGNASNSLPNAVMMSWDETNKIRQHLGLKLLPVEKVTKLKPRTSHSAKDRNSNLLQAVLHLIKELDAESLETVSDAIRNRLDVL